MSDGYETALDAIIAALISTIKESTSFAVRTYYDYRRKVDKFPTCLVKIRNDKFNDIGAVLTEHLTTFEIQIHHRIIGTETSLDSMIGYVGEIVDKLEASRGLGTNYVENVEILDVDYSQRAQGDAIFYYAYIGVEILHIRTT